MYDKVRRIDFLGSSTLVGTVGTLLLGFSLKSTEELPWSHPLIWGLFIASAVCCVGFVYVETYVSPYPVMPMRLITRRTPLFVSLSNLYVQLRHTNSSVITISILQLRQCGCILSGMFYLFFSIHIIDEGLIAFSYTTCLWYSTFLRHIIGRLTDFAPPPVVARNSISPQSV